MSKFELFGNQFRKFFQIASHEYQQPSITMRILSASPPVSSCILPATLLCKNRGKVTPPPENFSQHESHHLMSKIGPLGNLFRKFFEIASHKYQQTKPRHWRANRLPLGRIWSPWFRLFWRGRRFCLWRHAMCGNWLAARVWLAVLCSSKHCDFNRCGMRTISRHYACDACAINIFGQQTP